MLVAAAVVPMPAVDAVAAQPVVAPTAAMVVVTATAVATAVAMVAAISAVAHAPPTPVSHAKTQVIHRTAPHAVRKPRAQHAPRVRPWVTHSPALTPEWKPKMATAVSHAQTLTISNRPATPRRASRRPASRPATAATSVAPARAAVAAVVVDAAATVVAAVAVSAVQAATDLSAHRANASFLIAFQAINARAIGLNGLKLES